MRLHLKIWLAVLVSLLALALLSAGAWRLWLRSQHDAGSDAMISALADDLLPSGLPAAAWRTTLDRWHRRTGASLSLFAPDGRLLAAYGLTVSAPPADVPSPGESVERWRAQRGPAWFVVRLSDGRRLVAGGGVGTRFSGGFPGFVVTLVAIALVVGIGILPVVRRLTSRLVRLQRSVEALGQGDLSARVVVDGDDEVGRLARSFNASAQRIESLLNAQRSLLANASHELRSPLARIRMGIELIEGDRAVEARAEVARSIAELDALIDELLVASRLDAQAAEPSAARRSWREIDFTALLTECCAAYSLVPDTVPVFVRGDERLLRRLVRNLIENAVRHGRAQPSSGAAEVSLTLESGRLALRVCDRGPGVPESERERIFEPFYRARGASERDGGVGLGLSLVRQIAAHHDGSVQCLPRNGGGSCFEFLMSITPDRTPTPSGRR